MKNLSYCFSCLIFFIFISNLTYADNEGSPPSDGQPSVPDQGSTTSTTTEPSKDLLLKNRTKKPSIPDKKVMLKLDKNVTTTTTTTTQSEDVGYSSFPEAYTSETIDTDITPPPNINVTQEEDHQYYNSVFYPADHDRARHYWVDFNSPEITRQATMHSVLSNSYRRASTVVLSFDFPFYGHLLRNITVATGGFLFTGGYLHTWLAATQYVAPLMGNFDTSLHPFSVIRFVDNGTAFTVEWKNVMLKERQEDGGFTFQTTLYKNGDIVFVYKKVPFPVTEINNQTHPVKVGLADAYTIEKAYFHVKKKTIYEYHRVDLKRTDITNDTVIYFTAAPTCLQFNDCTSCLTAKIGFECHWCELLSRCSDGTDRHRQEWIVKNCHITKRPECPSQVKTTSSEQPLPPSTLFPEPQAHRDLLDEDTKDEQYAPTASSGGLHAGGLVALLVILGMLASGAVWVGYAYCNPHSASGQCLIRYRPSQWRFGHGEARYTAASIHM